MNARSFLTSCSVALVALGLTAAPVSAKPKLGSFAATFPVASKLCAKADAGTLPDKLAKSSDDVKAACTTLKTDYAATLSTYTSAVAPLRQQAKDAIAAAKTACDSSASAEHARRPSKECREARTAARATLQQVRAQVGALTKTYRTDVKAERKAFWATIHKLKGGADVPADTATSNPAPPGAGIPADSTVA